MALPKMPKSVTLGHRDFGIKKVDALIDDNDNSLAGQYNGKEEMIYINNNLPSAQVDADTLLHELLHGVWYIQNLDDKKEEEELVTCIAFGLSSIFKHSPDILKYFSVAYKHKKGKK